MNAIRLTEPQRGGSTPAATFDDPASLLHACHDRVQERCDLLEKLRDHVKSHGADPQAIDAASNVLRYFDVAAPLHHEDEEKHVFPRLLASGDAALVQCAQTLQQQHTQMTAIWQTLRPLLINIQQGDASALLPQAQVVDDFVALYRAHIELEESHAFPAGFADMPADTRQQMGDEMAQRRGAVR
ncbi:MAG: hemerythrin domain-containing protein [Brachymonas sp.]|nr:hemerythrin domain-containing protein [Brachymonas sp.]